MEKNKKVFILVGVLLLVIGVSFAYFVSTTLFGGNGLNVNGQTAVINGATIKVEGTLEFNDLDILPGHKTVSELKLTATGDNENIIYNLIWNGSNNLNTPLKFTVYKTSAKVEVSAACDKVTKIENGAQILKEECTINNMASLGDKVSSGTINEKSENTKVILKENEIITATNEGKIVHYYVILEYPNKDESQNEDIGGSFSGKITVEESNIKADITIAKVFLDETETNEIPKKNSGYEFNEEKSTCTNNAKPTWNSDSWGLQVKDLTISGTACNLYFDKVPTAGETILGNVTVNDGTPDFSKTSCSSGCGESTVGIYQAEDNDGTSYYYRGDVENNYIKFAEKYWRIIRINGDGSIRMIYDGTSAHANGTSTSNSIAVASQTFSPSGAVDDNMYVGFKYTSGQVHGLGTKSNALTQLETWYEDNLLSYANVIDQNTGFCGDRTPYTNSSGTTSGGGTGTTITYYGGYIRLYTNKLPILTCADTSDLYTVSSSNKGNKSLTYPIGLITADEVSMAGGVYNALNKGYYLYNGQNYWTLSSSYFLGGCAVVFYADANGSLFELNLLNTRGLRPVINLRSDTKFTFTGTGEKGSMTNPYIVVD